jgi:hypothetical protein
MGSGSVRNILRLIVFGIVMPIVVYGQGIETYESAAIDGDGNIRIVTSNHKTVIVRKEVDALKVGSLSFEPSSFWKPVISDDRRAVGMQENFGEPNTSDDLPQMLIIYMNGKFHRFKGGLPIFDWHFVDGSRRIAFGQQPAHFACAVNWELHDVSTERLLASASVPEPCNGVPDPMSVVAPVWVRGAISGIK